MTCSRSILGFLLVITICVGLPALCDFIVYDDGDDFDSPGSANESHPHLIEIESESQYRDLLALHPFLLIVYYAPWCFASRLFLPQLNQAAALMKDKNPPVVILKVDCTVFTHIAEEEDITQYPTVKWRPDFTGPLPYTGGRMANEIVMWVNRMMDREHAVASKEELDMILKGSEATVIGVFPAEHDRTHFITSSRHFEDVLYVDIRSQEDLVKQLLSSHNLNGRKDLSPPLLVLYNPKEDPNNRLTVSTNVSTVAAMDDFVHRHRFPAVVHFHQDTAGELFQDGRPLCFIIRDGGNATAIDLLFAEVAEEFRGTLLFSNAGTTLPHERRLMELVGLEDDSAGPMVFIVHQNPHGHGLYHPALKYGMEVGDLSDFPVRHKQFLEDFRNEKLSPLLKSEPVPDFNNGPVTVVVGKTFDLVVNQRDNKDVFVLFFAPWCGHCRQMSAAYEELGKVLKRVPSVVVAKIDATRNEIPGLLIESYPTMILFPADKKSKNAEFRGDRTVPTFLNFINQHATHKFNVQPLLSLIGKDDDDEDLFERPLEAVEL